MTQTFVLQCSGGRRVAGVHKSNPQLFQRIPLISGNVSQREMGINKDRLSHVVNEKT